MSITREVKYAPCGDCSEMIKRDDMHSVNMKFYNPDDSKERRIAIRLCASCRTEMFTDMELLRWDNSSMVSRMESVEPGLHRKAS